MSKQVTRNCQFCLPNEVPAGASVTYGDQRIHLCSSHHTAVKLGYQIRRAKEAPEPPKPAKPAKAVPAPDEIVKSFDGVVIGQDRAKQALALAVHQHYAQAKSGGRADVSHHVLLAGPSGCGKTLLARTIGETLNVPFHVADSTGMSPTGYVGAQADSLVLELLAKANNRSDLASRGVVLLDEVDKLACPIASHSDHAAFKASTQAALLRLIEGKQCRHSARDIHGGAPNGVVDSSTVLFMFAGAFDGIADLLDKGKDKTISSPGRPGKIGFRPTGEGNQADMDLAVRRYEALACASTQQVVSAMEQYGIMPELLGRIPNLVCLAPLSCDELSQVARVSNQSPLKQIAGQLQAYGYSVEFSEDFVEEAVTRAYSMATGTRALGFVVREATRPALYHLLGKDGTGRHVTFTADALQDPGRFVVCTSPQFAAA